MKKQLVSVFTAAVLVLTMTSCSFYENEIINQDTVCTMRFSWWGNDKRNKGTLDGINRFENENKNISITPEYGDYKAFKTKMDVEFYSDTEADIMQLDYSWLNEYSPDGNGFYNIYELSDSVDLDTIPKKYLKSGEVNGKLNGVPIGLDAVTFCYNKTLYNAYKLELPQTWDDLFKAAEKMKTDEVYPLCLNETSAWLCCAAYVEQTTGIPMFDDNGNFQYTETELEEMIKFYISLVKQKVTCRADEFNRFDFQNCKSGGLAIWSSEANYYCNPLEESGYVVDIGEYLSEKSCTSYGWYYKPSAFYAVKKDIKDPDAAGKFLDYLINGEEMAADNGIEAGVPISSSALETLDARDMLTGIETDASDKLLSRKDLRLMDYKMVDKKIIDMFTSVCDNVYYQKSKSDQAARNLYRKIMKNS